PLPFDLLYWNADSTRMPAMMHSFYLRSMYLENKLRVPDAVTLKGTPIDLGRIDVPAYFLSTKEDHIAPWASTYAGARLLKGPVRFVLAQSGHIAGVVNPPGSKYGHWVPATGDLPESPEAWLSAATPREGTWWTDWAAWLKAFDEGATVPARWPGGGSLPVIEDAPGSYVRVRADDD
ncbi:MAG: class I poly(R)-hydroxyalkanoic acid synthase, partial [Alphaproteobacteria bacterium]|nr:class I poly(R)-hydroxyalkanoic acid synthase [Alphaproteobacteria bacterium]